MPSYTVVDVDPSVNDDPTKYRGNRLVKISGVLWTVYVASTGSKVAARYSLDGGTTWSGQEDVYTPTTPTSEASWNYVITKDRVNNAPVIAALVSDAGGIKVRVFRRESSSWVAKGTIAATEVSAGDRMFLFQHSTNGNAWFLIWPENTTNNRLSWSKSTDDLASFSASAAFSTSIGSNGFNSGQEWFFQNADGSLYGFYGSSTGGVNRVYDSVVTSGWDSGAPSITNTDRSSDLGGPWSTSFGPKAFCLAKFSNGDLMWSHWQYVSGVGNHSLSRRTRVSGTWGSLDDSGYIVNFAPDSRIIVFPDDSWRIYTNASNTGTFSNANTKYHHKPAGSWVTVELVDEAKDHYSPNVLAIEGGQQTAGDLVAFFNDTDDDWSVVFSSDLAGIAPPGFAPNFPRPTFVAEPRRNRRGRTWIGKPPGIGAATPAPQVVISALVVQSPTQRNHVTIRPRPWIGPVPKTYLLLPPRPPAAGVTSPLQRIHVPGWARFFGGVHFNSPPPLPHAPHVPATGNLVGMSVAYIPTVPAIAVRAWIETTAAETKTDPLDPANSYAMLLDDRGVELGRVIGSVDPIGPQYATFLIPTALAADHRYRVTVVLSTLTSFAATEKSIPLVTVR